VLRESARELLDTNCGECHTRGLPSALPRALAVYDLTQLDWSRRMSDWQLQEAERRLREPVGPTRDEAEVRPIRAAEVAREDPPFSRVVRPRAFGEDGAHAGSLHHARRSIDHRRRSGGDHDLLDRHEQRVEIVVAHVG
jgi:hypothetical protein